MLRIFLNIRFLKCLNNFADEINMVENKMLEQVSYLYHVLSELKISFKLKQR